MTKSHTWRAGFCLGLLLCLGGCDALLSPEIEDCEQFLLGKLRAPAAYDRIEADKTLMDDHSPPQMWVSIKYDSTNSYGTPIRGSQTCKYPLVNGSADLSEHIDHDAPSLEAYSTPEEMIKAVAEVRESAESAAEELPLPPVDDDVEPASAVASDDQIDLCWEGYCPCDPPQGGADQLLCDTLRSGDADPRMLSVGKSMREVRRQIDGY